MATMSGIHTRHLDLNLLPVLIAVADTGSVTAAAARLYLTQSAVSAALSRLRAAVGEAVVTRHGRGIVLTERGARLVAEARPHLDAVVSAVVRPTRFDPATADNKLRLGLSDIFDEWLLPPLLRLFEREAPRLRLVCTPTQFRTVGEALSTRRLDVALTVADDLPASVARRSLVRSNFVCLFDPRFVRLGTRPTESAYLAQDHVIVSYNGDLKGVVEETFGRQRRIRCSVGSFSSVGAIVDGSSIVGTIPSLFVAQILELRPHLRVAKLPFPHEPGNVELLWPTALDADPACRFLREAIVRVAGTREGRPRKARND
ncbi:MAG: Transcriptional regulator, LysR family [Polyangiaceae bacterium]|jgi:LysR family transcriptional activator of mexEF-oprN operon|nr:Transcriptional regulator, LysR family [Polyangiaceae bacterium]